MKKHIIKKILCFLFLAAAAISCNDWLTVQSKEEEFEESVFSSYEGYRSALIGAYLQAASPNLWGQELTWGLMSVLSRNYVSTYLSAKYSYIINYEEFEYSYTMTTIANIWNTAYNVIANCNNILKHIENTDDDFFEYIWERDMIMSEARALRALMHFEMLRLFIPAPSTGYSGVAIPYVREYPLAFPQYNTMEEVFEYIIEDLEFALEHLRYADVEAAYERYSSMVLRTYLFYGSVNLRPNGEIGQGTGFFSYRGYRMNYWGVAGLLARVYSYKRDNATAVKYIDELLEEFEHDKGFHWSRSQYSSNPNEIDGKRIPEPLISFWSTNAYTNYETVVAERSNALRSVDLDDLFGDDIREDYRYIALYNASTSRYRVWDRPNDPAYPVNPSGNITKYSGPLLPVLELSELYYIRSEYYLEQGNLPEAIAALKAIRDARNVNTPIMASTKDQFLEVFFNDITREYWTRGQSWHFMKKMNWKKMYNGTTVPWDVPDMWYVLPLPDSEINFM